MSDTGKDSLSHLQTFKMERMTRSMLTEAPYNPRKISERNRKRLSESLKKNGLVMPIVWNRTTGNVVGGHQRLGAIDAIMHKKNYSLDVAVIEVSEKEEVALNIALNNTSAMGEFDTLLVDDLATEFGLNLESDCFFDRDDLLVSFGMDIGDAQVAKRDASADEALMQEIRDRKKEVRERFKATQAEEGDYLTEAKGVLTVVFDRDSDLVDYLRSKGVDTEKRVVHAAEIAG